MTFTFGDSDLRYFYLQISVTFQIVFRRVPRSKYCKVAPLSGGVCPQAFRPQLWWMVQWDGWVRGRGVDTPSFVSGRQLNA